MFTDPNDAIPILLIFGILCCWLAASITSRKEAAAPRGRDASDILRDCREGLQKVRFEMELCPASKHVHEIIAAVDSALRTIDEMEKLGDFGVLAIEARD